MSLLFETIRIEGGKPQNLTLHEKRLNNTRKSLFGCDDKISLAEIITSQVKSKNSIIRCRINYSQSIDFIECTDYIPAIIKTLKLVTSEVIDYSYKYSDRSELTSLIDKTIADDILIVRNGLLTDASYANIVFTDGKDWFTPKYPLLMGTMREKLLNEGVISEANISPLDINSFTHFRLINAMVGFSAPLLPVSGIIL